MTIFKWIILLLGWGTLVFTQIRNVLVIKKLKLEIEKLKEEAREKNSYIQKVTKQEMGTFETEKEKNIKSKARKLSLTHTLLVVELVVILVGLTGVCVTIKDMKSRVGGVETGVQRVEKQILAKDFKITSPSEGDSVDIIELIRGETPFSGMHHYVIVTPVKIGADWVQEEARVSPGGVWNGQAVFGEVAVGPGEKYVVRALATNSTLSPGPLTKVPKDAIFSESITVTRK
jgi:hypothetical protein